MKLKQPKKQYEFVSKYRLDNGCLYGKSDKNPVYADTAMHEDNKIAQYLIRKGADPNYKDKDGISLLMLAAQQGNIKFCKQLVEKGADVKYKKRGISALDYALSTGEIQDAKSQIELIEYLYQQKIPVTKMTKRILINGYRTGVYGDTSANTEYILQWGKTCQRNERFSIKSQ